MTSKALVHVPGKGRTHRPRQTDAPVLFDVIVVDHFIRGGLIYQETRYFVDLSSAARHAVGKADERHWSIIYRPWWMMGPPVKVSSIWGTPIDEYL